ncbi:MAG: DUF1365 domain-containing protein [Gammaproteobacteria bacterium]|nr:DUF1365 domain-containing protein [Gammaproteobacteria bacterium]
MLRDFACEGWVLHRRAPPAPHTFRYPVWMVCVDVDHLDDRASRWLSTRRRLAPLSLRTADFPRTVPGAAAGIRHAVNQQLLAAGSACADQVFLLTQPRSWGWLFNPVSFYFCYRGGNLTSVVAEVTNTPWNEVHAYVLDAAAAQGGDMEFQIPKRFHVSPFMPMDLDYHWRIRADEGAIEVAMRLLREGQEIFFAGLYLQPQPLTARSLRRGALAYPLQNAWTLARIYWQAWRVWRKGAAFHAHPNRLEEVQST